MVHHIRLFYMKEQGIKVDLFLLRLITVHVSSSIRQLICQGVYFILFAIRLLLMYDKSVVKLFYFNE